ncbi:MAG TPA: dolichyl-phosphate beta-glucosyltransferase [Candidatus Dormibacteraeota bacterium]|nr:dolichyl-phosphate beta-glucosyltransferase [Candidatus Dormibacteraeota bacterium]
MRRVATNPDDNVRLSIVIPAYNEEPRLPGTVRHAIAYLEGARRSYELVLVDDGSIDGTLDYMRRLQSERPRVRVIQLRPNRGKGKAVCEGVRAARGELILYSDADLSTPIEELPRLEQAIEDGADVAFGSRAAPGAREVNQPFYRRVMGKGFNVLVRLLLLPEFRDTQCGFKLFRATVARESFAATRTEGFAFDVEVLWRAKRAGFRVVEVPVRWLNSDTSRVSPVVHSTQMLRDLLRLRLFG